MKPIKPKRPSKRLMAKLTACASGPNAPLESTRWNHKDARAILAALEHERQLGRREGAAVQMDRLLEGPP